MLQNNILFTVLVLCTIAFVIHYIYNYFIVPSVVDMENKKLFKDKFFLISTAIAYEKMITWALIFSKSEEETNELLELYMLFHCVTLDISDSKFLKPFEYYVKKVFNKDGAKRVKEIYEKLKEQTDEANIPFSWIEPPKIVFDCEEDECF